MIGPSALKGSPPLQEEQLRRHLSANLDLEAVLGLSSRSLSYSVVPQGSGWRTDSSEARLRGHTDCQVLGQPPSFTVLPASLQMNCRHRQCPMVLPHGVTMTMSQV